MQSGPLLAAMKARVLAATSNKIPGADNTQTDTSVALPMGIGPTELIEPAQPGGSPPLSNQLSSQLPEDSLDCVLDSSAPSQPPNFTPPTTSEMSIDEEVPPAIPTPSSNPCDSAIQVNVIPKLGTSALVQTSPPSLLFADEDERPSWLLTSITDHLQHSPYYLCLNKVVDLFLAQEARLGYPLKVNKF